MNLWVTLETLQPMFQIFIKFLIHSKLIIAFQLFLPACKYRSHLRDIRPLNIQAHGPIQHPSVGPPTLLGPITGPPRGTTIKCWPQQKPLSCCTLAVPHRPKWWRFLGGNPIVHTKYICLCIYIFCLKWVVEGNNNQYYLLEPDQHLLYRLSTTNITSTHCELAWMPDSCIML